MTHFKSCLGCQSKPCLAVDDGLVGDVFVDQVEPLVGDGRLLDSLEQLSGVYPHQSLHRHPVLGRRRVVASGCHRLGPEASLVRQDLGVTWSRRLSLTHSHTLLFQ